MLCVARTISLSRSRVKLGHLVYMSLIDGYGALMIDNILAKVCTYLADKDQISHQLITYMRFYPPDRYYCHVHPLTV